MSIHAMLKLRLRLFLWQSRVIIRSIKRLSTVPVQPVLAPRCCSSINWKSPKCCEPLGVDFHLQIPPGLGMSLVFPSANHLGRAHARFHQKFVSLPGAIYYYYYYYYYHYSISRLTMIVRVNVILNRTVVGNDWRFDNPCSSHLQSQSELYHAIWWRWCYWLWGLVMSMVHFDPSIGTVKESFIRDLKIPRNRCTGNG